MNPNQAPGAQAVRFKLFTTNGTFKVPDVTTTIFVICIGGGGGGGGASDGSNTGSAGSGGGNTTFDGLVTGFGGGGGTPNNPNFGGDGASLIYPYGNYGPGGSGGPGLGGSPGNFGYSQLSILNVIPKSVYTITIGQGGSPGATFDGVPVAGTAGACLVWW